MAKRKKPSARKRAPAQPTIQRLVVTSTPANGTPPVYRAHRRLPDGTLASAPATRMGRSDWAIEWEPGKRRTYRNPMVHWRPNDLATTVTSVTV